jgi:large subunit ribosomal protein L18
MHIYSQLIDDSKGVTIVAVSTLSPLFRERFSKEKDRKKSAKAVGQLMAELAKKTGIERVVFDRGSYRYHGRVRALAEGAREGGLKF